MGCARARDRICGRRTDSAEVNDLVSSAGCGAAREQRVPGGVGKGGAGLGRCLAQQRETPLGF